MPPESHEHADPSDPPALAAPRPEFGSRAWLLRRRAMWDQKARDLMAAVAQYEDEHPDDVICLAPMLEASRNAAAPEHD